MPSLYLFIVGLFTSLLCVMFLVVSIREMKRLNPGPSAQEGQSDAGD